MLNTGITVMEKLKDYDERRKREVIAKYRPLIAEKLGLPAEKVFPKEEDK